MVVVYLLSCAWGNVSHVNDLALEQHHHETLKQRKRKDKLSEKWKIIIWMHKITLYDHKAKGSPNNAANTRPAEGDVDVLTS